MKTNNLLIILATILFLISCEKNTNYSIEGILLSDGIPLKNAIVDIDGLEQYKTSTNSDGYFTIQDVSKGTHSLNTKKNYTNGSYIQKSYNLNINNNLNLNELLLPNPVTLLSISIDSTNNLATIKWNKSHADDFREYKLYSHSSSGLDETTGTLEHIATNVNDTTKEIQLNSFTETFFRVFVLNNYGQLGGSNILSVHSMNTNLLVGGDFESESLFNEHWTIISGTINIIDSFYYAGNNCLFMQNIIIPDSWEVEESLIDIPVQFDKNIEYKLSFWYKISGIARMDHHTLYFYYYQEDENQLETNLSFELGSDFWLGDWIPGGPFKNLDDTGWLYYSKTFVPSSTSPARFKIGGQIENIMFDNLEIKINE